MPAALHRETRLTPAAPAAATPPPLQGLPEPSAPFADELLTRTRRRGSEPDALGHGHGHALHHPLLAVAGYSHADHAMALGAGAAHGGLRTHAEPPASASNGSHGHSWFASWFGRGGSDGGGGEHTAGAGGARAPGARGGRGLLLGSPSSPLAASPWALGGGDGSSSLAEQEEVEVEVIRRLVGSYYGIVRRNLQVRAWAGARAWWWGMAWCACACMRAQGRALQWPRWSWPAVLRAPLVAPRRRVRTLFMLHDNG